MIAAVAGGISDRLGVVDLYVRAGLLVLRVIWGIGLIIYLVLWAVALDRTHNSPPALHHNQQRRIGYPFVFAGGLLILRSTRDLEQR